MRKVAERAEIDVGHLSRIERGHSTPSAAVLYRIARALGLKDLSKLLRPYVGGDGR